MKAICTTKYGDSSVLEIRDLPIPTIKNNELLIKVIAFPVNIGDSRIRRADPAIVKLVYGFKKPRNPVLGLNFAGIVESVGEDVTKFKIGDKVHGSTLMKMGTHAEYCVVKDTDPIIEMPENISFSEAASLNFGFSTAIHFISFMGELEDKKILINGASGAVGTAFIQILKTLNARITTLTSNSSMELVKNLGAYETLDYNLTPPNKITEQYDIVIDCVNKISMNECIQLTTKNGYIVCPGAGFKDLIFGSLYCKFKNRKFISGLAVENYSELETLNMMIEQKLYKPVIDGIYTFEDFKKANERVDSGKKKGNVVIEIASED